MQYSIQKQKIIRLSALMTLTSFSSILIVHIIRAAHLRLIHFLALLLGIAPNFLASIGLPFLLLTFVDIVPEQRMVINVSLLTKKLVLYCFIVCIGLSLWELVQNIYWQYPIDNMDILASFVGSVLAFIIGWYYIKVNQEQHTTKNKQ
jgi:hypothetical protein